MVDGVFGCRLELAEPRSGAVVRGDRVRLTQAVGNLVANALEHGDGRVRLRRAAQGDRVRIEVDDEGPGCRRRSATSPPSRAPGAGGGARPRHRGRHCRSPRRPLVAAPTAARRARRPRAPRVARADLGVTPPAGRRAARPALLLGVLAASDVAGREAALRRQMGPPVRRRGARAAAGGRAHRRASLAVREVPERYAPPGAPARPGAAVGQRAAVAIAAAPISPASLLAVPVAGRRAARPRRCAAESARSIWSRSAPPTPSSRARTSTSS
jgi:hypothetical protein